MLDVLIMLVFQLFYNNESNYLNNYILMGQFLNVCYFFIY